MPGDTPKLNPAYLEELRALRLPAGHYAIYGSGPLAARGIRAAADLDIIVSKTLWAQLVSRYPAALREHPTRLAIGNLELYATWPPMDAHIPAMLAEAEEIGGFPFVPLRYVMEWKQQRGREKDRRDLLLIREYLRTKGEK